MRKNRRNPYRILATHLPYVLARLNLAAVAVALGSDVLARGDLKNDIDALVRLAKKQTIASGNLGVVDGEQKPAGGE